MRWLKFFLMVILPILVLSMLFIEYWDQVSAWAKIQQRNFQNMMSREILALRSGDIAALLNLLLISGAYGIVHAIGPGHGKVLIGAAAITSEKTALQMAGIGFISSLFQGVTAILLTYGILGVLLFTSATLIGTVETYLAPVSFLAMAAVGAWIIFRGVRLVAQRMFTKNNTLVSAHDNHHDHSHTCSTGCRHMPSVKEIEAIRNWRDILAIVLSIGIRPCSGALIVLIITWKFGLMAAGILSVMSMAIGTGLIVAATAIFASKFRNFSFSDLISTDDNRGALMAGGLNIGAGLFVIAMSSLFLMNDLQTVLHPF